MGNGFRKRSGTNPELAAKGRETRDVLTETYDGEKPGSAERDASPTKVGPKSRIKVEQVFALLLQPTDWALHPEMHEGRHP